MKISDDWTMDTIVVEEVMISAPEITYEIGSNGSNIDAIQSNVEKVAGGSGSSDSSSSGEDGPKVVINDLYIKGGKINISASFMDGSSLSTDLPDIHLTDIGKESGGASPAEVADEIISAITKYSSSAASGIDLSSLGLADISGKAADVAGEVGDTVKDAAEEAGGLLEGLLGN